MWDFTFVSPQSFISLIFRFSFLLVTQYEFKVLSLAGQLDIHLVFITFLFEEVFCYGPSCNGKWAILNWARITDRLCLTWTGHAGTIGC